MNRIQVVQRALRGRTDASYLEIGVAQGAAFRQITAKTKIAVDPRFNMSDRARRQADARGRTHYYEHTSDRFFASAEDDGVLDPGVDVALIDGLHTGSQVVTDVDHTLRYLKDDGVIVLHDCNPATKSIGYPAADYDEFRRRNRARSLLLLNLPAWSGDVWKAIVTFRCRSDIRVTVLDCDRGVGVVTRGTPGTVLDLTDAQVDALTYADLKADRRRLLNLQPPDHLDDFLAAPADL